MSAADENKSNLISDAYDIWSKDYDDSVNPTRDLDTRAFGSQGFDLRDKAVVEVGCGTGRHTEALMIKFGDEIKSYTAFDLSQGMLEKAEKRLKESSKISDSAKAKVKLVQHSLYQSWPCKCSTVDLVFENLVLEHIKDLDVFFAEAGRLLTPGGQLFISEYHPFRLYKGRKAVLRDDNGVVKADPPSFSHDISDYVMSGINHGLELVQMKEWRDDDPTKPGVRAEELHFPRVISFLFQKK